MHVIRSSKLARNAAVLLLVLLCRPALAEVPRLQFKAGNAVLTLEFPPEEEEPAPEAVAPAAEPAPAPEPVAPAAEALPPAAPPPAEPAVVDDLIKHRALQ